MSVESHSSTPVPSTDSSLRGGPSGGIVRHQYSVNVKGSTFLLVGVFEETGVIFEKKKKGFKPVFMRLGDFETLRSRAADITSALAEKLHGARIDTEHNKVGIRELFGKHYVNIWGTDKHSIYLSDGEFARLIEIFADPPVASSQ